MPLRPSCLLGRRDPVPYRSRDYGGEAASSSTRAKPIGVISGLPVIQEFLESIHKLAYQYNLSSMPSPALVRDDG